MKNTSLNDFFVQSSLEIKEMQIKTDAYKKTYIVLEMLCDDKIYLIRFENVSSINLNEFSYPFQIEGFQVLDNSDRGWEKSQRYKVWDFEDDVICFYCEKIDVLSIKEAKTKIV